MEENKVKREIDRNWGKTREDGERSESVPSHVDTGFLLPPQKERKLAYFL